MQTRIPTAPLAILEVPEPDFVEKGPAKNRRRRTPAKRIASATTRKSKSKAKSPGGPSLISDELVKRPIQTPTSKPSVIAVEETRQESKSPTAPWERFVQFLAPKWLWIREHVQIRRVKKRLRVCESISLGEKRFVAVIQVDGQEFLVGGAVNSMSTLAYLDRRYEFQDLLKTEWSEGSVRA